MTDISEKNMKSLVESVLEWQGYVYSDNGFHLPDNERETKRRVHNLSKAERVNEHYKFIKSKGLLEIINREVK